jgi:hypothetical protein
MRDRAYLDWLKERDCVIELHTFVSLETTIIDPAHGPASGARLKGPDSEAIPLCRHHHAEQHQIGWPAFEAKYGFSREKEAAAHYALYRIDKENG